MELRMVLKQISSSPIPEGNFSMHVEEKPYFFFEPTFFFKSKTIT
jgi:hypothetical protein